MGLYRDGTEAERPINYAAYSGATNISQQAQLQKIPTVDISSYQDTNCIKGYDAQGIAAGVAVVLWNITLPANFVIKQCFIRCDNSLAGIQTYEFNIYNEAMTETYLRASNFNSAEIYQLDFLIGTRTTEALTFRCEVIFSAVGANIDGRIYFSGFQY